MTTAAEVALGAFIVAAHNRIIGSLEKAELTVVDKFKRRLGHPGR